MNGRAVKDFASQWARAIPPSIAHILHEKRSNHGLEYAADRAPSRRADNSPYAYTMSERLAPQEDRVTLVTNFRLVCDATRPVTSQQPTVGNVTAVDWKPVNP
jgi:hypothetical protein